MKLANATKLDRKSGVRSRGTCGFSFSSHANFIVDISLVASSGIEPELSALRGRRVNQLHHDATMGRAEWIYTAVNQSLV
jgi:hypothetical protein